MEPKLSASRARQLLDGARWRVEQAIKARAFGGPSSEPAKAERRPLDDDLAISTLTEAQHAHTIMWIRERIGEGDHLEDLLGRGA